MPALLHPGVYVMEIPSGARSIEGVPTSTTIFVGETERGPLEPTKIKGRSEYERLFGGYFRRVGVDDESKLLMPYMLDGFFANGGSSAYILRAMSDLDNADKASRKLGAGDPGDPTVVEAAYPGAWGNDLRVVVVESGDGDDTRWRFIVYYSPPGGSLERVEVWDKLSLDPDDENYVADVLRRSLYIRWPAEGTPNQIEAITGHLDNPGGTTLDDADDWVGSHSATVALTGGIGGNGPDPETATDFETDHLPRLEGVDDAALLVAAAEGMLGGADYKATTDVFLAYVNARRPKQDLFFVGDLPRLMENSVSTAVTSAVTSKSEMNNNTNFAAIYWPHIDVGDPVGPGADPTIVIPPSGHVAGLFARIDGRRGVWKAPAGTEATLAGIRKLDQKLLDGHSDDLNPKGINALRLIPGAGSVVWGARTMIPSSEWRYVPVRRTAIFLRMSIYNGIQWAVFEPNDEPLWDSLRTSIGDFMETQFRNGAFAGSSSKEAYFVKCDAETTPESDQAAGVVNVLVGFAPLRPAEFVVVKLSQKTRQGG